MKTFLVKWELDIAADTPREAVKAALSHLRSESSDHKLFKVVVSGGHGAVVNLAKVESS